MWHLIKVWWTEYVDLMAHSYLIDEANVELDIDQKYSKGEM